MRKAKSWWIPALIWAAFLGIFIQGMAQNGPFRMFVDFPCMATVDERRGCLSVRRPGFYYPEDKGQPPPAAVMQVFLSTWSVYWSGGGCNHSIIDQAPASVSTNFGEVQFDLAGDTVLVDGRPLPPGESFRRTRWMGWNFWAVSFLEISNAGLISDCPWPPTTPGEPLPLGVPGNRVVVLGGYGTRRTATKGLASLFLLGWMGVFFSRRARRQKDI